LSQNLNRKNLIPNTCLKKKRRIDGKNMLLHGSTRNGIPVGGGGAWRSKGERMTYNSLTPHLSFFRIKKLLRGGEKTEGVTGRMEGRPYGPLQRRLASVWNKPFVSVTASTGKLSRGGRPGVYESKKEPSHWAAGEVAYAFRKGV